MNPSEKYIKGTEYDRTYKAASGKICPVIDSKTTLQNSLRHPAPTIEDKFDRIVLAFREHIRNGMDMGEALAGANMFWQSDKVKEDAPFFEWYGLTIPTEITREMLEEKL